MRGGCRTGGIGVRVDTARAKAGRLLPVTGRCGADAGRICGKRGQAPGGMWTRCGRESPGRRAWPVRREQASKGGNEDRRSEPCVGIRAPRRSFCPGIIRRGFSSGVISEAAGFSAHAKSANAVGGRRGRRGRRGRSGNGHVITRNCWIVGEGGKAALGSHRSQRRAPKRPGQLRTGFACDRIFQRARAAPRMGTGT